MPQAMSRAVSSREISKLMPKLRHNTHDLRLQIQPSASQQAPNMTCCVPNCPDRYIQPGKPRLSLQIRRVYLELGVLNDRPRIPIERHHKTPKKDESGVRGVLTNGEVVGCLSCYEQMMVIGEDYLKKSWSQLGTNPEHPIGYILPYILPEQHFVPVNPSLYIPSAPEAYALEFMKAVQRHLDDLRYGEGFHVWAPAHIQALSYDDLIPSRHEHDSLYIDRETWSIRGELDKNTTCEVVLSDVQGQGLVHVLEIVRGRENKWVEDKRRLAIKAQRRGRTDAAINGPDTRVAEQCVRRWTDAGAGAWDDRQKIHMVKSERIRRLEYRKLGVEPPGIQIGGATAIKDLWYASLSPEKIEAGRKMSDDMARPIPESESDTELDLERQQASETSLAASPPPNVPSERSDSPSEGTSTQGDDILGDNDDTDDGDFLLPALSEDLGHVSEQGSVAEGLFPTEPATVNESQSQINVSERSSPSAAGQTSIRSSSPPPPEGADDDDPHSLNSPEEGNPEPHNDDGTRSNPSEIGDFDAGGSDNESFHCANEETAAPAAQPSARNVTVEAQALPPVALNALPAVHTALNAAHDPQLPSRSALSDADDLTRDQTLEAAQTLCSLKTASSTVPSASVAPGIPSSARSVASTDPPQPHVSALHNPCPPPTRICDADNVPADSMTVSAFWQWKGSKVIPYTKAKGDIDALGRFIKDHGITVVVVGETGASVDGAEGENGALTLSGTETDTRSGRAGDESGALAMSAADTGAIRGGAAEQTGALMQSAGSKRARSDGGAVEDDFSVRTMGRNQGGAGALRQSAGSKRARCSGGAVEDDFSVRAMGRKRARRD